MWTIVQLVSMNQDTLVVRFQVCICLERCVIQQSERDMNVSALYATRSRCSWRLLHCKCSQWQYSKHLLWYVFTGLLKAIDCISCWCVLFAGEFVWFRSGSVLVLVALQRYACLCIHTIVNVPYYMVRGCSETFQVNRKCCSCVRLLSD